MGEGTSPRLDRVTRPDPTAPRMRGQEGTQALYSTAPGAAPSPPVIVTCNRCEVERGTTIVGLLTTVLRPPFVLNPLNRHVWARCPTCRRRAWLRLRAGQSLRVLLDR